MNLQCDNNTVIYRTGTMTKEISNVYTKLFNAIMRGELVPGERLLEVEISKSLNVSRTPIRAALKELERQKLVQIVPYKGAFVALISYEEAKELLELCAVLEEFLCRNAAKNIDAEGIKKLHDSVNSYENALKSHDMEDMQHTNLEFHTLVAHYSQNRLAEEIYSNIQARMNLVRLMTLPFSNRDELSLAEHREIVSALVKKDPDLAAEKGLKHIELVADVTLKLLKKKHSRWKTGN